MPASPFNSCRVQDQNVIISKWKAPFRCANDNLVELLPFPLDSLELQLERLQSLEDREQVPP